MFNAAALILSALVCCLYFFFDIRRAASAPAPAGAGSERAYAAALFLAALLAVTVRVYRFGAVPGGFNQDGAMAAVDAKALADYGTDRLGMRWPVHLTAWGFGQMSALMSYLMVPFIKLFGLSAVTARLPCLLASLGGLACLYLFSRDVFGKWAGLAVLFFAAVDPWHIVQSRWALDCNLFPHFFMAGLYFLNRGVSGRGVNMAVSMLFFGLSMYCYGISIYTVPLFLLAACVYLLAAGKIKIRRALMALAVYLLAAWPFIAVMAVNYFQLDSIETPLFTIPYFPDSVRSQDILFFSYQPLRQLAVNFRSLVNVVFLQKQDLLWNEVPGFGVVYLFSMPFAVVGLAELARRRREPGCVLALMFLLTGVFAGLVTDNVNVNRVNIIFYPLLLLCGAGLWRVMARFRALRCALPALYLAAFVLFARSYFTSYADSIADCFYADFGAAVSSLADDDAGRMYITADTQYEGSANVSEILTLFWQRIDAKYYQGGTAAGETPFSERYVFKSMGGLDIDPDEDAVYVLRESDLPLFDSALFDLESFGGYYVARPAE